MSAELCRFNLLLEGLAPGKPLSFLDGHIKVGNSLLGTTPDLIRAGIPDDAFKPIEGDDKATTSAYRKRNKAEREAWESNQGSLDFQDYDEEGEKLRRGYERFEAAPDRTACEVREKQARYEAVEDSEAMVHRRLVADTWCAAFVWPKTKDVGTGDSPPPITTETLHRLADNARAAGRETLDETRRVAEEYGFFHWHVAFPNVFGENVEEPGFDVVLSNPPWERIKLQEQEWFAARSPEIATAPNAAARKRKIKALVDDDPDLHAAFLGDLRKADGTSHLIRSSGRFPLCGRGDINTYSIFAETKCDIISDTGRVGCIVPSGIATDNTTKDFFADLVSTQTLASLYDFENKGIFVDVDSRMKFSLLTLTGARRPVRAAEFAFFCHAVSDLRDPERRFPLSAEDIRLLNPNTRTCPIFRTRRDAEITKEIYRRVPVLIDENKKDGNPWGITFLRMFDMSNDSGLFRIREELEADGCELAEPGNVFTDELRRYLPLYEGKMFDSYNHRAADVVVNSSNAFRPGQPKPLSQEELQNPRRPAMPQYWVNERDVISAIPKRNWIESSFIGFKNVTSPTNARTFVGSLMPLAGFGNSMPIILLPKDEQSLSSVTLLSANLSSYVFDYAVRQKISNVNLNFFIVKQIPVPPPETYDAPAAWEPGTTLSDWISSRVLELTYTAWDLAPFARDLGYDGPPFTWDPERRFRLRSELDAAFFHLYGIAREDVEYIMDTFPIVKRKDEAAHGEYRTKRVILEIYDHMSAATPEATSEPAHPEAETPPATVTRLRPPARRAPGRTSPREAGRAPARRNTVHAARRRREARLPSHLPPRPGAGGGNDRRLWARSGRGNPPRC